MMDMRGICQNCESVGELHRHHVVPRSMGGKLVVFLCERCHSAVHEKNMVSVSALTKAGLERTRQNGTKLGRPRTADVKGKEALALKEQGLSYAEIGKHMGITKSRVCQLVNQTGEQVPV